MHFTYACSEHGDYLFVWCVVLWCDRCEKCRREIEAEQLCFDFFVWLTMCLEASIFFEFFFPIWRTRDRLNKIRGTKNSFLPPPPLFRLSVTVWCDSQFARLNGSIFGFCRKTLVETRFFVSPQDSLYDYHCLGAVGWRGTIALQVSMKNRKREACRGWLYNQSRSTTIVTSLVDHCTHTKNRDSWDKRLQYHCLSLI